MLSRLTFPRSAVSKAARVRASPDGSALVLLPFDAFGATLKGSF